MAVGQYVCRTCCLTALLPYCPKLLLLPGNRLRRPLAGAGVGMRALAACRQRTAMAQAAVAAEVHQSLDVHRDFAAQIALDLIVAVDGFADLEHLGVGKLVDAAV